MDACEGGVEFSVPEQPDAGKGDAVFFNPQMELNRDVTVAVLRAFRDRESRAATYVGPHAASGVRGVRAAADGWDVTMADVDADAVELARENAARNGVDAEVVHRNANAVLYDRGGAFDVVDVDPFGTPMPFADAALSNVRELVCVTATDTAPLCGAHFRAGVRRYSAVPRNTEYHAEMGLRVLLSALARTAARHDVGVTPILSHVTDHYARTYLELSHRATDADEAVDELGHVYHCQDCLWRESERGLLADAPGDCPNCGENRVVTAGPVWLGAVRDPAFVAAVRDEVGDEMGAADRARSVLDAVEAELDTPTHYDQHRLYGQWGEPAVGMDEFLASLWDAGFAASRTQYGGTTFKTTASVAEIAAATPHPEP